MSKTTTEKQTIYFSPLESKWNHMQWCRARSQHLGRESKPSGVVDHSEPEQPLPATTELLSMEKKPKTFWKHVLRMSELFNFFLNWNCYSKRHCGQSHRLVITDSWSLTRRKTNQGSSTTNCFFSTEWRLTSTLWRGGTCLGKCTKKIFLLYIPGSVCYWHDGQVGLGFVSALTLSLLHVQLCFLMTKHINICNFTLLHQNLAIIPCCVQVLLPDLIATVSSALATISDDTATTLDEY